MPIRQAQGRLSRGQASRESEVCSFLRHSVRLLAEGVAGPARICNAGAGYRDTNRCCEWRCVAEEDRGDGAGSLSRVFTVIGHPQGTPLRMPWGLTPFEGRVSGPRGRSLAWARVARLCVCFKRAGENAGLGRISGKKWRRRGEEVGRVWGWMRQGWERVARQGDVFSGTGERVGRVWARVCGRGVRWGVRGKLGKQYGERKAMAVGSEWGAGAGCWRGRRFWAHLVI